MNWSKEKFLAIINKIVLLNFALLRISRIQFYYTMKENSSWPEAPQKFVEG